MLKPARHLLPLAVIALLTPSVARAGRFHLDVDIGLQYAQATQPSDGSSMPTLGEGEAGAALTFQVKRFYFGARSDLAYYNQYSTVDPSVGNRRGLYLNYVSPVVGMRFGRVAVELDFRMLGNYTLTNVNAALQTLTYTSPLGGRATISALATRRVWVGVMGEFVNFSGESVAGSSPMAMSTNLTAFGLLLGLHL